MNPMDELLPLTRIFLDVEASSKKRLFEIISQSMADLGAPKEEDLLSSSDVFECLLARERLGSTGLGQGVAIPHGRHVHVAHPMGAFFRLKEAVEFDAADGKPVQLVFVLLVPAKDEESNRAHLAILAHLAERFADKQTRQALLNSQTPEALRDLLMK